MNKTHYQSVIDEYVRPRNGSASRCSRGTKLSALFETLEAMHGELKQVQRRTVK